ncbi:hypothetical protein VDG1235_4051 [Verrucomicrobiia bacterium DG1235]|nr:hypothetical protein VDG1235_4051 [Verrucomicrobiae bacterium DG1235]
MRSTNIVAIRVAVISSSLVLAGCSTVPAYQQQHLSKPGMTFSDSLVETTQASLTSQMEPGAETSGGAQASGCSACR